MNRTTAAIFAAIFIVAPAAVKAASTPALSPENAVKLKAWFDHQKLASSPQPQDLMFVDGAVVSTQVPLHQVPEDAGVPAATKLDFAKIGDRVVLVDPTSREIAYLVS